MLLLIREVLRSDILTRFSKACRTGNHLSYNRKIWIKQPVLWNCCTVRVCSRVVSLCLSACVRVFVSGWFGRSDGPGVEQEERRTPREWRRKRLVVFVLSVNPESKEPLWNHLTVTSHGRQRGGRGQETRLAASARLAAGIFLIHTHRKIKMK